MQAQAGKALPESVMKVAKATKSAILVFKSSTVSTDLH